MAAQRLTIVQKTSCLQPTTDRYQDGINLAVKDRIFELVKVNSCSKFDSSFNYVLHKKGHRTSTANYGAMNHIYK
ncbi:hypothetical protein [Secundilactobacillus collinoides]|uniref:Uncharacterized protein n=2 Tax=Secundilactobacillus collinoides TaxID=33960 RepID=A0A0R2BDB9_SECCO|nr:hypothetical protein [Secundilactobacillus collinoides]KRM77137.1 hypothetical protein FC82_GL000375 [Secundilactobacillus collinoides DSM 20515 = JCM 1123]KZL41296.1 hypothetical protein TY91_07045 [Secundilactobacillus collinoides]